MRLANGRWQNAAIYTMMRFSRVGHYAVAGVLLSGAINALMILGVHVPWQADYVQFLLFKCALVALMVAIALANRVGTTAFYQDDTGRSGAGGAGTGNGQSVRHLGTLLTRLNII